MPVATRRAAHNGPVVVPIHNWPAAAHDVLVGYDWSGGGASLKSEWDEEDRVIGAVMGGRLPNGTTLTLRVTPGRELWMRSGKNASVTTTVESVARSIVWQEKNPDADLNKDGSVTIADIGLVVLQFGLQC